MTLEEIAAHLQIQQVLYRYCRGIDRGDVALIASVYHPGAQDDHGPYKGPGAEFAPWIVAAMDQTGLIGQHHITNILIELEADTARVESYFLAYHPDRLAGAPGEGLAFVGGRYLDRFEKRAGQWKIADRRVIYDFDRTGEKYVPWAAAATGCTRGAKRGEDPSHGFVTARAAD
jgi:hypothetical protein